MEGPLSLVAMLCRTSDRAPEGSRGAEALARELGERRGVEPRYVGTAGDDATALRSCSVSPSFASRPVNGPND